MAEKHSKAEQPLPPTKTASSFKDELSNFLHAQHFYHEALLALMQQEDEPDWVIGAVIAGKWLRQPGEGLVVQLDDQH